ncbi:SURF1 family protein [Microbacterium protaetiae]|uniref:SURF1-like protein n=2 Tax=Microbacterium protaetiae TaxID=2509458 RepID=A0A4P6EGR7_9MICO|nr:SURF1 family protein [Microbacterium protaetiae]
MLRPRWLAMLALCLVVAGVFAWLGQWQLGRALDTSATTPGETEQVLPIEQVVEPGAYLNSPLVGQKVQVSGHFVAGDFIVVSERMNGDDQGFWVTGQFRLDGTENPTSLAVAVGWAATLEKARDAASTLNAGGQSTSTMTGRLISDEGPRVPPRNDPDALRSMSPAALLSRWHDIAGLDVYRPYLVADQPLGSLVRIVSHAPAGGGGLNWLNLFYAAEWAVFAGFAFYLWYRLARDAWEKEVEELADAQGGELA